jgi:glutathione peroxidase
MNIYDISVPTADGKQQSITAYKGKVLLIVNTASKCGFTPQFKELEELYQKYGDQGLVVLGFPCNQFANQDPLGDADIQNFCQINYGVSFPMFAKVYVKGDKAHELFKYLTNEAPGIFGSKSIKWNFTKFLVDAQGQVRDRYAPTTSPIKVAPDIEKLLAEASSQSGQGENRNILLSQPAMKPIEGEHDKN